MIGQTISHYKILEKLGGGGMGVVYKAEDIKLKRTVALKFLPPSFSLDDEAKKRFIHEAQAASSLQHNNICNIHDMDETEGGQLFICMDYYEGETLKQKNDKGPLKIDDAINIICQLAEGLLKAHEKEIIHRDIKPANIFITNDGVVKILDFGLAKVTGQTQLTQMGSTVGTVAYMSPEQTRGETVDRRTDIWSLGVVFYEMLTGQLPFKGDYEQAIIYSILNENSDLSKIPEELIPILQKAITKSSKERYQKIEELTADLNSLQNKTGSGDYKIIGRSGIRKISFKKRLILASILIVISALYAIYYVNFRKNPSDLVSNEVIRKMIVVLPFENLGPQDENYFAEGISDEITHKLASIGSIGVISRNSAEKIAKSNKSTTEIGKELGVSYILSGTIRWAKGEKNDSRIRITPQLIRVSDNTITWSDSYDKVLNDIFAIQNDIAQKVVDKLGVSLLSNQIEKSAPPTKNLTAYDIYLKGLSYYRMGAVSKSATESSISLFNKAIELDPEFALAYAHLSMAKARMYFVYDDQSSKNVKEVFDDVQKSYQLNPKLAEVHLALGHYYYWLKLEYDKAIVEFDEVLKIQHNSADAYLGLGAVYRRKGEFNLAIQYFLKGAKSDPLSIPYNVQLASTYIVIRDYKNADKYLNQLADLNPELNVFKVTLAQNYIDWKADTKTASKIISQIKNDDYIYERFNFSVYLDLLNRNYDAAINNLNSLNMEFEVTKGAFIPKFQALGFIYKYKKETALSKLYFDSSRIQLEKMLKENPQDERLHSALGITYAALGEKEKAIKEGKKGIKLLPLKKDALRGYRREKDLAKIYILINDYDNALKQIDFLLSIPGEFSVNQLKLDPIYDPLRNLPDYKTIIKKYTR